MTIRDTDRRPLVDGVDTERPLTGGLDSARAARVLDDVANGSHASSYGIKFRNASAQFLFSEFDSALPQGMKWVDRLNARFAATGWSKAELAKRAGVPYDNVLKYLGGKVDQPRGDTLEKLAVALDATVVWLEHGIEHSELTTLKGKAGQIVPILVSGFVKAGVWQDARIEGPQDMVVPSIGGYPGDVQIAYIVDGNSLNKIARNGDILVCLDLIKTDISIKDNDLVIVEISKHDGEFIDRSAKRVRRTKGGYELWPESDDPAHQEPLVLNDVEDGVDMRVAAKVLWIVRKP